MKTLRLLPFISMLIFASSSFAQVGYVITKKNDTIKGEVKLTIFGAIRLKTNSKDGFKKMPEDSVNEYQLTKDSNIYISKVLPTYKKPWFVRWVERGNINMYEQVIVSGGYHYTNITYNWYVSKNSDSLIAVKTSGLFLPGGSRKERKAALADMLGDKPKIADAYKADDSFTFNTIQKYIELYNGTTRTEGE